MSSKTKNRCTSHEGNYLYSPVHLSRHFAGGTAYIYVSPEKQKKLPHQRALPINRASTLHSLLWAIKSWK